MTRFPALLLIFLAIAANAEDLIIKNHRDKAVSLHQFTVIDQAAMLIAKGKVLNEEVPAGSRVEFTGDKNSGYYEVASIGHFTKREDVHCREIQSRSGPLSLSRVFCMDNRDARWREIENPNDYVVTVAGIKSADDLDDPAEVSTGDTVFR